VTSFRKHGSRLGFYAKGLRSVYELAFANRGQLHRVDTNGPIQHAPPSGGADSDRAAGRYWILVRPVKRLDTAVSLLVATETTLPVLPMMDEEAKSMSLIELGRSVCRNWFLLLLCGLAAGGAAFAITSLQTREYRSTTLLVAGPAAFLERPTRIGQTVDALNRRSLIATFAEIIGSKRIFGIAADTIGLSPADQSRYSVASNALPEANAVLLDVQGPRREVTASLSPAITAAGVSYITDFYKTYSIKALDLPDTPKQPVSPRPRRDVPAAVVAGLGLGLILGLWRDRLRDRGKWASVGGAPTSGQ
jgi:capsular polysaccharide biosynthesis protein